MENLKVQFERGPSEDSFTVNLRTQVDAYFSENKISPKANLEMMTKTFFYLGAYFGSYLLLISDRLSTPETYLFWLIIGVLTPLIGFNVGHDAIHGAYSSKAWLNRLMGQSFTLIGANVYIWRRLHNVIHHSYTNIAHADGDLYPVPFLRFHASSPKRWWHPFQHWYAPLLYCFTSLVWVFRKDYEHIFKKQHLIYKVPHVPKGEIPKLFFFKVLYYIAFLIIPFMVMSQPWWHILLGFLAMHAIAGFLLALVFQLGHMVEGPEFPEASDQEKIKGSWFEHQLRTSSNFSMSRLSLWLCGGLDYQIEHHLFPKVCHVHYPAISGIVQKVAKDYGLPYYRHETFLAALKSHFYYLKTTGRA